MGCHPSEKQKKQIQNNDTSEKVILITLDGLRWEEVFQGIDSLLLHNKNYTKSKDILIPYFWDTNPEKRREKLMPFFWNTVVKEGFILGNRSVGSKVNLTNTHRFSYPGYNEILSGRADDENIYSNDKIPNPNKTILELGSEQGYKNSVAAFGSWDRFKFIINESRSGIPINDGYNPAPGDGISEKETYLNHLQKQAIMPWASVRQDVFTHNYALEYMKRKHPKLIYISYGETDDFAHDGDYTHYILATRNTDAMIKELWEFCQRDSFYKGKTSFIITTDHGRGKEPKDWQHHGNTIVGSDEVWIAGLGSQIDTLGESMLNSQFYSNQIAQTIGEILNIKTQQSQMGKALYKILKK